MSNGKEYTDNFNLVIIATSRKIDTNKLNLSIFNNIKYDSNNKLIGGVDDNPYKIDNNIYALGDALSEYPELTPLAIKMEKSLANSLKNNTKLTKFDKNYISSCIYTNPEYSFVGLSEKQAKELYGEQNITVYHSMTEDLEQSLLDNEKVNNYIKIICLNNNNNKILGMHFIGNNAGEIMQGFGLTFKQGLYKHDLDNMIGIHPTNTEGFVYLNKIKKDDNDLLNIENC